MPVLAPRKEQYLELFTELAENREEIEDIYDKSSFEEEPSPDIDE
jgi:hypothetical protein